MKVFKILVLSLLVATGLTQCTKSDDPVTAPTAYDLADAQKGGMLYDALWNKDAGSTLDSATVVKLNAAPNFFKCKACHGPEYKGFTGKYINRTPLTAIGTTPAKARPSVTSLSLAEVGLNDTPQDIFDEIRRTAGRRSLSYDLAQYDATAGSVGNEMPDYTTLLTDAQVWDIVKFIKTQTIDISKLYTDSIIGGYASTSSYGFKNIGLDGNATNGKTFYTKNCASCHGTDGKTLAGSTTFKGVGYYVRNEPYNIFNVVRFGRFSSTTSKSLMPAFAATDQELKDLYKACADDVAFPL